LKINSFGRKDDHEKIQVRQAIRTGKAAPAASVSGRQESIEAHYHRIAKAEEARRAA
tara:strand:+ start:4215 stop:4385 length:171 start_codon:yes stop_codon:yes gene_type:complete